MDTKNILKKEAPAHDPRGKRYFCYAMLTLFFLPINEPIIFHHHCGYVKGKKRSTFCISAWHYHNSPCTLGAWSLFFPWTPEVHGDPVVGDCAALTLPSSVHHAPFSNPIFPIEPVFYWTPEGNGSEDQPELCNEDNLFLTGILFVLEVKNYFVNGERIQRREECLS